MKLELKHLAPYLPYDLKLKYGGKIIVMNTASGSSSNWCGVSAVLSRQDAKIHPIPILIPLSDITAPQILGMGYRNKITLKHDLKYNQMSWRNMNYLIEKHFDVFGLIPNGLAINFNTLNKTS